MLNEAKNNKNFIASAVAFVTIVLIGLLGIASFRIQFLDTPLDVLALNANRLIAAISAGAAFALSGITFNNKTSSPVIHLKGFAALTIGISTSLWLLLLEFNYILAFAIGVIVFVLAYKMMVILTRPYAAANFVLALTMLLVVFLWIYSFGAASVFEPKLLWLMGDLNAASKFSILALILVVLTSIWLFFSTSAKQELPASENPRFLLMALGVGIAGPLFFIGWLAPLISKKLLTDNKDVTYFICTALIGSLLVVSGDIANQQLFGGYAPPSMLLISIVGIFASLEWNRQRLLKHHPNKTRGKIELGLILLSLLATLYIFIEIANYVESAT